MPVSPSRRRAAPPRPPLVPRTLVRKAPVPTPDTDEIASGRPARRDRDPDLSLTVLSVFALFMAAAAGPASALSDSAVIWQFGKSVEFGPIPAGGPFGNEAPDNDGGAAKPARPLVQVPGYDWQAPPIIISQAGDGSGPNADAADDANAAGEAESPHLRQAQRDVALMPDADGPVAVPGSAAGSTAGSTVLPDRLRQAVLLDPRVAEMSARACQMAHRLGLARAEGRPKVSATVSGSRQLVGRIKRASVLPDRYLTPQQREIKRSGAHTREFDHREKNNIYDGKISVRHTIIDWGERGSRAEARALNWQAAQIDARVVMRERSHDLLQLSLTLRRSDEVIAALKANFDEVKIEVEAVRARVEAGAGRLSDLREAQLVQLDQEIAINRAEAERDIILEHLETEFDLTAEDGWLLAQAFLARRHPDLAILPADRTDKAHAIRLRARGVTHEADEIRASRYPKFDAVIDGTIFDMTDYEDEYEVVGKLEMSVPLYDGGTAKARLRENAWRENELKSSLDALVRAHGRESEGLAQRFNQMTREETEALARRDELAAQLRSLRARQGRTVSSPLALARLLAQIGAAEARLAEIRFDHELLRARALLVAEQIDSVLGLSMEDSVC